MQKVPLSIAVLINTGPLGRATTTFKVDSKHGLAKLVSSLELSCKVTRSIAASYDPSNPQYSHFTQVSGVLAQSGF